MIRRTVVHLAREERLADPEHAEALGTVPDHATRRSEPPQSQLPWFDMIVAKPERYPCPMLSQPAWGERLDQDGRDRLLRCADGNGTVPPDAVDSTLQFHPEPHEAGDLRAFHFANRNYQPASTEWRQRADRTVVGEVGHCRLSKAADSQRCKEHYDRGRKSGQPQRLHSAPFGLQLTPHRRRRQAILSERVRSNGASAPLSLCCLLRPGFPPRRVTVD